MGRFPRLQPPKTSDNLNRNGWICGRRPDERKTAKRKGTGEHGKKELTKQVELKQLQKGVELS